MSAFNFAQTLSSVSRLHVCPSHAFSSAVRAAFSTATLPPTCVAISRGLYGSCAPAAQRPAGLITQKLPRPCLRLLGIDTPPATRPPHSPLPVVHSATP